MSYECITVCLMSVYRQIVCRAIYNIKYYFNSLTCSKGNSCNLISSSSATTALSMST